MYTVSFSIEYVYWSLRLLYWVSCLWEFVCELSDVFLSFCFPFCLSRYVFYVWETSDLFLGTPYHCLLHYYMHRWFDCSPWHDLRGSVLIWFPFDLFFFSFYPFTLSSLFCFFWFTYIHILSLFFPSSSLLHFHF